MKSLNIEERLKLAYPNGVPAEIVKLFRWESSSKPFVGQLSIGGPVVHANSLRQSAASARQRERQSEQWASEIESRLGELQVERSKLVAEIEQVRTSLNFRITGLEMGAKFAAKEGCDLLISGFEAELTRARKEIERVRESGDNWQALASYAAVIAGERHPDDLLAEDLGFKHGWELYPEWKREEIAKRLLEDQDRAKIVAAEGAQWWDEYQAKAAEDERKRTAAMALVDALDFAGLIRYVYEDAEPGADVKKIGAGPGTINDDKILENALGELNRMQERKNDPAHAQACQRLREIASQARWAPGHNWSGAGWESFSGETAEQAEEAKGL